MTSYIEICSLLIPGISRQPLCIPQAEVTIRTVDQFHTYDLPQEICDFIFANICETLPTMQHTMKCNDLNITLEFAQKYGSRSEKGKTELLAAETPLPLYDAAQRRRGTEKLVAYLDTHKNFFNDLYTYNGWLAEFEIRDYAYPRTPLYLSSEPCATAALDKVRCNLMSLELDSPGSHAPVKLRGDWPSEVKRIEAKSNKKSLRCGKLKRQLVHSKLDSEKPSTLYLTFGLNVDCYLISNKSENTIEAENMTRDLAHLEGEKMGLDRLVGQVVTRPQ